MTDAALVAPQMVLNTRMLYFGWIPADPEAAAALIHPRLRPIENRQVFMSQYVVDAGEQTSGFGSYSLTYLGADLQAHDTPDGAIPGRWWTHYFNSSAHVRSYAGERGVPASEGTTTLELSNGRLVATTSAAGTPVIRTEASVGSPTAEVGRGQLRYITEIQGRLVSGLYPFVSTLVDPWQITSLEFLEPGHSVYALRPAEPLQVTWGFYSPNASFCYPGGEEELAA